MKDYFQRNERLRLYNSDFRVNHSTETCLSWSTDMILSSTEN